MMFRIGVDVGGTYTDLVATDESGRTVFAKSPSTPADQSLGVMAGLEELARRLNVTRAQMLAAMDYSWRRWQIMVGDDYGIRWLPTYEESRNPVQRGDWLDPYYPNGRRLAAGQHPFPVDDIVTFDTMYVETGRFLRQMIADVQIGGGNFVIRDFATSDAISTLPEKLVFNCTGLGARQLFGDNELQPVRGQLAVLLPQPEVRYAFAGSSGYMFPRADGILLGGTFERDVFDANPDPADIARIVRSHQRFFQGFRCTA